MDTQQQAPPLEPGRSILILVFGILSVTTLGPILGVPAWIMGSSDLAKIDQGRIAESERGLTKAGMILGIVGSLLFVLVLLIVIPLVCVGVAMS